MARLVAVGPVGDREAIEVLDAGSDLDDLILQTAIKSKRAGCTVVIDRASPARSAVPSLEKAGVKVRLIPMTEFAAACGDFHDAAKHARIAHNGDYRLADAVASASKRQVGEAWAWRRRGAAADITPLCAATMARWGVLTQPEPRKSAYDDDHDLTVV